MHFYHLVQPVTIHTLQAGSHPECIFLRQHPLKQWPYSERGISVTPSFILGQVCKQFCWGYTSQLKTWQCIRSVITCSQYTKFPIIFTYQKNTGTRSIFIICCYSAEEKYNHKHTCREEVKTFSRSYEKKLKIHQKAQQIIKKKKAAMSQ